MLEKLFTSKNRVKFILDRYSSSENFAHEAEISDMIELGFQGKEIFAEKTFKFTKKFFARFKKILKRVK